MVKSKNKKFIAACIAGASLLSNVKNVSAFEYRNQDSHMYGGGQLYDGTYGFGSGSSSSSGSSSGSSSSSSGSGSSTSSSSGSSSSGGSGSSSSSTGSSSGTTTGSGSTSAASSSGTGSESSSGKTSSGTQTGSGSSQAQTNAATAQTAKSGLKKSGEKASGQKTNFFTATGNFFKTVFNGIKTAVTNFCSYIGNGIKNVFAKIFPPKAVGDPVIVTEGKFYTNEIDMSINYGSSVFDVTRNYSSQEYPNGVFGKNWSSVLDSRIIRGTGVDNLNELKTSLAEIEKEYESYCQQLKSVQMNPDSIEEVREAKKQIEELKTLISDLETFATKNPELNTYSVHGYESVVNQMTPDSLLFIEDDGAIVNLVYSKEQNKYNALGSNANKLYVENADEGFVVRYLDGSSKHFDKWGMLTKIQDRFSSAVDFEYYNSIENNVRRLESVLKNGIPILNFQWKNNRISKITNLKKSTSVSYSYNDFGSLISFIDIDGESYGYDYDDSCDLIKMIKPDGSFTKIDYTVNGSTLKKKVGAVANEEGFKENFTTDETTGKASYTDADGNIYYYNFENNHVTHEEVAAGYEINRTYNFDGMVETLSNPFETVSYSYDEFKNLIEAKYNDGTSELWSYIQPYNLLSTYVNRDGVTTEFAYSANGGLEKITRAGSVIQKYERDSSGRVVDASGIYLNEKYIYDSEGRVASDSRGTYGYDSKDRVVSYLTLDGYSWHFAYSDDNKIQTATLPGNLYVKSEYNNRKDLIKKTQKDLLTGETRIFEYEYDSRHLPLSSKIGIGKDSDAAEKNIHLKRTYEYYNSGKIKSMIDWNFGEAVNLDAAGVKRTYTYDKGNVNSVSVVFVDKDGNEFGKSYEKKYSVKYSDGKKVMSITDGNGNVSVVKYNGFGQNVEMIDATGRSISCEFSPAGTLKSEISAQGGKIVYDWDFVCDSVKKVADSYSNLVSYSYDEKGRLKSESFVNGDKTEYEYSENNGITKIVEKSLNYTTEKKFDSKGVELGTKITDKKGNVIYDKIVDINKNTNTVTQKIGEVQIVNKLSAWGDASEDSRTGTKFSYDENGNCILIDDGKTPVVIEYNVYEKISSVKIGERFTKYCYDAAGNLLKSFDNAGTVSEFKYDDSGNMIWQKGRVKPETKYDYDAAGTLIKVTEAGDVIQSIQYSKDLRQQKITDGNGKTRVTNYDNYGNVTSITDRLGKTRTVSLNRNKGSVQYTDFNGKKMVVTKSGMDGSVVTTFADGQNEKIIYDALGSISRMQNSFGTQSYDFDSAHQLTAVYDGDQRINYSYDNLGRVKTMSLNGHNYNYDYFDNGSLKMVSQGDFSRSFEYDEFGQQISAIDNSSSGIFYEYDEIGRPVLTYQKDRDGKIIFLDGIVYGDDGRVICNFDQEGKFTTFDYDSHGRVTKVCTPFIQTILDDSKDELSECGKTAFDSIILEMASVDSKSKAVAKKLLNKVGLATSNVDSLQEVWAEYYSFDGNGNRISKTTPAGKMEYEYDAENRLTKICGPNAIVISYDNNGNMISRKSGLKKKDWKYSQNNRVLSSTYSDYEKDVYYSKSFGYDCIGRRTFEKDSNGNYVHNLYDGFSFNKIYEWQDKNNSYSAKLNTTNNNSKIRFRDIDNTISSRGRSFGIDDAESCSFDRYFLYAGEKLAAQFNEGYLYSKQRLVNADIFAYCTDYRGSVRSVVDEKGDYAFDVNYGLNGQPYFSTSQTKDFVSVETAASFGADMGFAGKKYDSMDGTYNFGFRNYSPSLARFVTEDPIQDGENWYNYCKGDPINFVDLYGLKNVAADMTGKMTDYGKDVLLGNSTTVTMDKQGCYATTLSGVLNTLKNKTGDSRYTPLDVNDVKSNFAKDSQCLDTWAFSKNYNVKYQEYIEGYNYNQIAQKINEFDKSSQTYCLAVKMQIYYGQNWNTSQHWITAEGGTVTIGGKQYLKVIGSLHTDTGASRHGWIDKDGATYAPIEQLIGVRAFTNDEPDAEVDGKDVSKKKNK